MSLEQRGLSTAAAIITADDVSGWRKTEKRVCRCCMHIVTGLHISVYANLPANGRQLQQ